MAAAATKPWDARLAHALVRPLRPHALVRPLRHTAVHPNHLTTVRLLVGGGAAAMLAACGAWLHAGAGLFAVSAFLDHTDGELARMTGKTSRAGHVYDLVVDAAVMIACFVAMGFGVRGALGGWGPWLGLLAGAAIAAIFTMFQLAARVVDDKSELVGSFGGFEAEDCLYLIAPLAWVGALPLFLAVAAAGAPLFAVWFWRRHRPGAAPAEKATG